MKHKRHSSPSPNRAGHLPKLRKTSFAWIAGQSLTRNGMATYTPSNQIISLRNRNHNPYRLRKEGKKRKKERPEYSRNFMNGLSQRSARLVLWKTTSFILQTKLTWSRWRRLSCLRAAGAKQAVSWWHAPSRRGRETPLWSHSKPLCNSLLCFFFLMTSQISRSLEKHITRSSPTRSTYHFKHYQQDFFFPPQLHFHIFWGTVCNETAWSQTDKIARNRT